MNEEMMQNMDIYTSNWEFDRVIEMIIESFELDYWGNPKIKDDSPLPAIAMFFEPEKVEEKVQTLRAERDKEEKKEDS